MPRYALLLRASGNRAYGESAFGLAAAELGLLTGPTGALEPDTVERTTIAGVDYLVVDARAPLTPPELSRLALLSSLHAVFAVEPDGRFRPEPSAPVRRLDEDLVTIQRYAGKTNEAFTHLLVNVALAATTAGVDRLLAGERLRLFDPACGRGTSLNRAALYGMDACGVELDPRDVEAYDLFLSTWLQDKRLKHQIERATLRKGRPSPAHRFTVTYGAGKDVAHHRVVDVVHDDTVAARHHFKARSMDLLVCDLPYGVQHGSRSRAEALARSPQRLLEEALPVWFDLLRPGAGIALAWNRRTLTRTRLIELVRSSRFAVADVPDDAFVHRVDRSIERDVVVAAR